MTKEARWSKLLCWVWVQPRATSNLLITSSYKDDPMQLLRHQTDLIRAKFYWQIFAPIRFLQNFAKKKENVIYSFKKCIWSWSWSWIFIRQFFSPGWFFWRRNNSSNLLLIDQRGGGMLRRRLTKFKLCCLKWTL